MLHSNRQQTWRPTHCMWEQPKHDKCKGRKREWGSAGIQVTGVTHNQVIICLIMQHIDDTVGVYGSTDGHSTEVRMWQLSLCLSETQDCTVTSGFMIKPQHLRATCSDIFNTPELQPNHTSFNVQLAFMSHYSDSNYSYLMYCHYSLISDVFGYFDSVGHFRWHTILYE